MNAIIVTSRYLFSLSFLYAPMMRSYSSFQLKINSMKIYFMRSFESFLELSLINENVWKHDSE